MEAVFGSTGPLFGTLLFPFPTNGKDKSLKGKKKPLGKIPNLILFFLQGM